MEWLLQNWVWLALGIGAIFLIGRGSLGYRGAGHQTRDHGMAGGWAAGDDGLRRAAPASDAGQPGTAAAADTASTGAEARATPAQAAPAARRRHGCC